MDYLRNQIFFIKGTHSQRGSTYLQLRKSAGNAGAHSQASISTLQQEGVQAVLTLSPGGVQAVQILIPRQAVLTPCQEGV